MNIRAVRIIQGALKKLGHYRGQTDDLAYDAWWRFWEEEGWFSLGRTRNFDWMHVQAAKLAADSQ